MLGQSYDAKVDLWSVGVILYGEFISILYNGEFYFINKSHTMQSAKIHYAPALYYYSPLHHFLPRSFSVIPVDQFIIAIDDT